MQAKTKEIEEDEKDDIQLMDDYHFYDEEEENRGWWSGFVLEISADKKKIRGAFDGPEEWNLVIVFRTCCCSQSSYPSFYTNKIRLNET